MVGVNYFLLLLALLKLSPSQFKLLVDSIIWSFKHNIRDISDMGLQICLDILVNFSNSDPEVSCFGLYLDIQYFL